jgi:dTDP-4-dehydrorhamnose 3,5-epimerase
MNFTPLPLQGAYIIEPNLFADHRGKFSRLFCQEELKQIGHDKPIVQINHSLTKQKGTVRGMHYQKPPKAEIKMVQCLKGEVFDVLVDLRKNSLTFLKWHGEILSANNMKMMYIPEGFAHGFQSLDQNSEIIYFVTEFYNPLYEAGIRYNDPEINIEWLLEPVNVSEKDQNYPLLNSMFEGVII